MKFSIIIPCYNHGIFLTDAINSLISQSYNYWEAIIVNDGSTDNTIEISNYWCKKDSRIKLVSVSNNGLSSARNTGIEFSTGEYIALLDADDKYKFNHLESLLNVFQTGSDIAFTGYSYFSDSSVINHSVRLNKSMDFQKILDGNIVPPVAVAFKKNIFDISGGFDTSLKSAEDWDLWIRCYKIGFCLGISEESSAFYRISANSMSRQFLTMYEALKNVSLQAYAIDSRISIEYPLNKSLTYQNLESIKKNLLLCIGVAILQNKNSIAIDLFRHEMFTYKLTFISTDFKYLCSYLSFRYHVSKEDLKWVFETLYPRFLTFFKELSMPGLDINKTMKEVFSVHTKIINRKKWGLLSPLVNRIS